MFRYWFGGRIHEESTGTADVKAAKRFAKDRREKIGAHRQGFTTYVPARAQQVTVDELLDALERDMRLRRTKSVASIYAHLRALRARFRALRAAQLTGRQVNEWIDELLAEGALKPATINRRTQLLTQAYRLERAQDAPGGAISCPPPRRWPQGKN